MDMWKKYFNWLLKRLKWKKKNYTKLLHFMFDTPFEVVLDRDENRLEDGRYLRNHFFLDNGIVGDFTDKPVSVLEVLIALADRIDTEYLGNPSDPRPDIIFWEFLCNLGLNTSAFQDNRIEYPSNKYRFESIINTFMYRNYAIDGQGGIFPLKNVNFDVADMELWEQMQAYLSENYGEMW